MITLSIFPEVWDMSLTCPRLAIYIFSTLISIIRKIGDKRHIRLKKEIQIRMREELEDNVRRSSIYLTQVLEEEKIKNETLFTTTNNKQKNKIPMKQPTPTDKVI